MRLSIWSHILIVSVAAPPDREFVAISTILQRAHSIRFRLRGRSVDAILYATENLLSFGPAAIGGVS